MNRRGVHSWREASGSVGFAMDTHVYNNYNHDSV